MDNERWQPESSEALDTVDAIIHTSSKKSLAASLFPCRGDTKRDRRRKIILDISLMVVFLSAIVLVWVTVIDPGNHGKEQSGFFDDSSTTASTEPGEEGEPTEETPPEPEKVRKSHAELKAMNSEYIGWLKAPGGSIDMPVVQTLNNNYYLYRNFVRKPSRYGNPFMDSRVSLDPKSTNLIIYGHHMRNDGSIFSKLLNYQQVDTVKKNPLISLEMPGETLLFKIFAVVTINGRAQDDNGYVFYVNTPEFPNRNSFEGYIRQLEQRTLVKTGVDVTYGDTLICLQTCQYDFTDQYLYVIGRLVREGETPGVDVSKITKNQNPRLPQALLTKRGIKNQYLDAERWDAPK